MPKSFIQNISILVCLCMVFFFFGQMVFLPGHDKMARVGQGRRKNIMFNKSVESV